MSTLKIKNDNPEFRTFPRFLRDYANYLSAIESKSEKTISEYLMDLRTFFRFMIMTERDEYFPKKPMLQPLLSLPLPLLLLLLLLFLLNP